MNATHRLRMTRAGLWGVLALFVAGPAIADENRCAMTTAAPEAYTQPSSTSLHALPHRPPNGFDFRPHHGTHGQLVLGRDNLYFYHLPVFMSDPWAHPHNFQVVLEMGLRQEPDDDQARYKADRDAHPSNIYTAAPLVFDQTTLVLDYPGHPPLRLFDEVDLFRNHFEQPDRHEVLVGVPMTIERVVYFREFDPESGKPPQLAYLLFGRGDDLFLTHLLAAPEAEFDQVLKVSLDGELAAGMLENGVFVTFDARPNTVEDRLKAGEAVTCPAEASEVTIRVEAEPYCEIGELAHVVGVLADKGFGTPTPCPSG